MIGANGSVRGKKDSSLARWPPKSEPLLSGVWTHGMLYVALGRVTDPDNLRVVAPKVPGDAVVNVVYTDVLEVGEARCSTQVG